MQKTSVLLFGITVKKKSLFWSQIKETVDNLRMNHDNLDIKLLLFDGEPYDAAFKEKALKSIDQYHFEESSKDFQRHMIAHIKQLIQRRKTKGNSKLLIMSCCYNLQAFNFWNSPLTLCCDYKPFLESQKELNPRFMYGNARLLEYIWSKRKFQLTYNNEKNMFLNASNIIGHKKLLEHTYDAKELNLYRAGWGVE